MRKSLFYIFLAICVSFSLCGKQSRSGDKTSTDSIAMTKVDSTIRSRYASLNLQTQYKIFLDEEGEEIYAYYDENGNLVLFDDEAEEITSNSSSPRIIRIHSGNGVYFNAYVDGFGNTTIYDSNGDIYNIFSDGFGNSTMYAPNGDIYSSYSDDFGNTTMYGPDGEIYNSYTDGFGNTTTYGPDGEIYNSYTDDFGNSTTYGPDGEIYNTYTDDFGSTTIYGN